MFSLLLSFFLFFSICMWKWCCDKNNIWLPVFDGFTRSGKSQARFDNFCLFVSVYACLSIYLCVRVWYKFWNEMKTICLFLGNACLSECASPSDKIFVAQGSSKTNVKNLHLIACLHNLKVIRFWYISLNRWCCCSTFFKIYWIAELCFYCIK